MKIDALLLIGPTGAGKSPLGDLLETRGISGRRCHHFDFGHQLRTIASEEDPPEGFASAEHRFIGDVLEKALLLEREHFPIAEKILRLFLRRKQYRPGDVVVLNGLPRHEGQAADMDEILSVRWVAALECSPAVVYARIKGNTGGDRAGRDDDDMALIEKKLGIFMERTAPLLSHYADKGSSILRIGVTAEATAGIVYASLLDALGPRVKAS